LCGEAALRSGAGRVTLATDPGHAGVINHGRPELMASGVAGDEALRSMLNGDHVLAVGPGLGRSAWSESLLGVCLATDAALVIDADALNLLAEMDLAADSLQRANLVLTPHPAEAARLLGCQVVDVQNDRVAAAQGMAKKYNATVVLKGCGTVIAAADGDYAICPFGNPGMATAGSGDVLSGVIAALLGQGLSGQEAAVSAVLAHALAADIAVADVGEMALLAGDITNQLHKVWMKAAAQELVG